MAVVLALAASILGFLAAVIGWAVLDFGLFAGLALWSGGGLLGLVLALAIAHLSGARTPPATSRPQPV